jgi:hypothetical protein
MKVFVQMKVSFWLESGEDPQQFDQEQEYEQEARNCTTKQSTSLETRFGTLLNTHPVSLEHPNSSVDEPQDPNATLRGPDFGSPGTRDR